MATTAAEWESKRDEQTKQVEDALKKAGFEQVDSYRYNSASIRLRVIDKRFEGLPISKRDDLIEPHIDKLPEATRLDIITLLTLAPSEVQDPRKSLSHGLLNLEFEQPSRTML